MPYLYAPNHDNEAGYTDVLASLQAAGAMIRQIRSDTPQYPEWRHLPSFAAKPTGQLYGVWIFENVLQVDYARVLTYFGMTATTVKAATVQTPDQLRSFANFNTYLMHLKGHKDYAYFERGVWRRLAFWLLDLTPT